MSVTRDADDVGNGSNGLAFGDPEDGNGVTRKLVLDLGNGYDTTVDTHSSGSVATQDFPMSELFTEEGRNSKSNSESKSSEDKSPKINWWDIYCGNVCYCNLNPGLVFSKVFYFAFVGGVGCVLPYVSIYLKQMGLSPEEIGLISGLRPMVGFLSGPLYGALGDRFHIKRWLLLGSILAWLAFYVGLLFVPPAEISDTCPVGKIVVNKGLLSSRFTRDLTRDDEFSFRDESQIPHWWRLKRSLGIKYLPRNTTRSSVSRGISGSHGLPVFPGSLASPMSLGSLEQRELTTANATNFTSGLLALQALTGEVDTENGTNRNGTLVILTFEDKAAMKEYLGWIYDPDSLFRVFIVCLSLIVAGEAVQSPTTALADAGTLQMLESEGIGADGYGAQRAWGAIGFGISSLLAGGIVSSSRTATTICGVELYFSDYRMLAYVFIGFLVTAFAAATQIKFKEGKDDDTIELTGAQHTGSESKEKPKEIHNTKAVIRIFCNVHYGSWLSTSFFVGICNGVIWGFLFWHLENLGADQLLMGVASTVTCFSEFIMFFFVGKLIKVFGHMGIMYTGLLGYALRFCVYALLKDPWWVLPAEVLQGITFSSVWVSMTAYTTLAVPSVSLATIQGILHGVYFGLGNGTGHLVGGLMIGYFGAVTTFYVFSVSCVVVFILFIIAQKCSTKPDIDLAQFHYKDVDGDKLY